MDSKTKSNMSNFTLLNTQNIHNLRSQYSNELSTNKTHNIVSKNKSKKVNKSKNLNDKNINSVNQSNKINRMEQKSPQHHLNNQYKSNDDDNHTSYLSTLLSIIKLLISKYPYNKTQIDGDDLPQHATKGIKQKQILEQLFENIQKHQKIQNILANATENRSDKEKMLSFLNSQRTKILSMLKLECARNKLEALDSSDWKQELIRLYSYITYQDRSEVIKNHKLEDDLLKEIYGKFDEMAYVINWLFGLLQNMSLKNISGQTHNKMHNYIKNKPAASLTIQELSQKIFQNMKHNKGNSDDIEKKLSQKKNVDQSKKQCHNTKNEDINRGLKQQNEKLIQEIEKIQEQFEYLVEDKLHLQQKLRRQHIIVQQHRLQIKQLQQKNSTNSLLQSKINRLQANISFIKEDMQQYRSHLFNMFKEESENMMMLYQKVQIFNQYNQHTSKYQEIHEKSQELDFKHETDYSSANSIESLGECRKLIEDNQKWKICQQEYHMLSNKIEEQSKALQEKQLQINKYLKIIQNLKSQMLSFSQPQLPNPNQKEKNKGQLQQDQQRSNFMDVQDTASQTDTQYFDIETKKQGDLREIEDKLQKIRCKQQTLQIQEQSLQKKLKYIQCKQQQLEKKDELLKINTLLLHTQQTEFNDKYRNMLLQFENKQKDIHKQQRYYEQKQQINMKKQKELVVIKQQLEGKQQNLLREKQEIIEESAMILQLKNTQICKYKLKIDRLNMIIQDLHSRILFLFEKDKIKEETISTLIIANQQSIQTFNHKLQTLQNTRLLANSKQISIKTHYILKISQLKQMYMKFREEIKWELVMYTEKIREFIIQLVHSNELNKRQQQQNMFEIGVSTELSCQHSLTIQKIQVSVQTEVIKQQQHGTDMQNYIKNTNSSERDSLIYKVEQLSNFNEQNKQKRQINQQFGDNVKSILIQSNKSQSCALLSDLLQSVLICQQEQETDYLQKCIQQEISVLKRQLQHERNYNKKLESTLISELIAQGYLTSIQVQSNKSLLMFVHNYKQPNLSNQCQINQQLQEQSLTQLYCSPNRNVSSVKLYHEANKDGKLNRFTDPKLKTRNQERQKQKSKEDSKQNLHMQNDIEIEKIFDF